MIYEVNLNEQNNRLDKFLTAKLESYTRSHVQKMIKEGLVVVNGKKVAPHFFLRAGDQVTINKESLTINKEQSADSKTNEGSLDKIKIIEEAQDFLVIEKPVGLLVHPDQVHHELTLIDWLAQHFPDIKKVGDNPLRPGIVHRLDRDVSGLMVIAKTQAMFDFLKTQFKKRQIKKEYLVLVNGRVSLYDFSVDLPISRAKAGYFVAQTDSRKAARSALTEFAVIKRLSQHTLLRAVLKTGRTHQIRVHLKSRGHSIVGDKLYKTRDIKSQQESLGRPFLHAIKLGFFDLANNWQEFDSALPTDLAKVLKQLK